MIFFSKDEDDQKLMMLPEHVAKPVLRGFVGCRIYFTLSSDQVETVVYEGCERIREKFLL